MVTEEACVAGQYHHVASETQAWRQRRFLPASPAGVGLSSGLTKQLQIVKRDGAAAAAGEEGIVQARHRFTPFALAYAAVQRVAQATRKGSREEIADELRV